VHLYFRRFKERAVFLFVVVVSLVALPIYFLAMPIYMLRPSFWKYDLHPLDLTERADPWRWYDPVC